MAVLLYNNMHKQSAPPQNQVNSPAVRFSKRKCTPGVANSELHSECIGGYGNGKGMDRKHQNRSTASSGRRHSEGTKTWLKYTQTQK